MSRKTQAGFILKLQDQVAQGGIEIRKHKRRADKWSKRAKAAEETLNLLAKHVASVSVEYEAGSMHESCDIEFYRLPRSVAMELWERAEAMRGK